MEDLWDPLLPSSGVLVCSIRTDREQPNNNNDPERQLAGQSKVGEADNLPDNMMWHYY